MLHDRPQRVADVLHRRFDEGQAAVVVLLFLDLHRSSESHDGGPACFVRRHAAADVVGDQHLQVRVDLAIEVVVLRARAEGAADARDGGPEPAAHGYRSDIRSSRPITPAMRPQFAVSSASCRRPARVIA